MSQATVCFFFIAVLQNTCVKLVDLRLAVLTCQVPEVVPQNSV